MSYKACVVGILAVWLFPLNAFSQRVVKRGVVVLEKASVEFPFATRRASVGIVPAMGEASLEHTSGALLPAENTDFSFLLQSAVQDARFTKGVNVSGLETSLRQASAKAAPPARSKTRLPGFQRNWPDALSAKRIDPRSFQYTMSELVQDMYPYSWFWGTQASSFNQVLALTKAPYPTIHFEAKESVARALRGLRRGYAVVVVLNKPPMRRAIKDVLVLDMETMRPISVLKSQGWALARRYAQARQQWRAAHPKWAARLDKQGFVLDTKKWRISKDGVRWADIPNTDMRQMYALFWREGARIQFEYNSWRIKSICNADGRMLAWDINDWMRWREPGWLPPDWIAPF